MKTEMNVNDNDDNYMNNFVKFNTSFIDKFI